MDNESGGNPRLALPESYYVERAEREKEERERARREGLAKKRADVLLQAKKIAVGLQATVYLVHCSPRSRGEARAIVLNDRTPDYAILLDSNKYLRREAVFPDGTVCECEEYT